MPKLHSCLVFLLFIFAYIPQASGLLIDDPENVTYMKVSMTQSGHLRLHSLSSSAMAETLKLSLYIAQNDSRQASGISRVIGPSSYRMGEDDYGNSQIIMEWENPPLDKDIDYLVETVSEVRSKPVQSESRSFPVTELVEPSPGIVESAYMLSGGEISAVTMLRMGAWVFSSVKYDLSYEDVTLPAKWVYENRKGTCDEYANLMLSMLKAVGYKAWYVAGYAYLGGRQEGASSFGAHAWLESEIDGKTYSADPTWAESPVDATHLTVARLPDSNFTEHTEVKSRDVRIEWNKDETRLNLIERSESPGIDVDLEVVPDSVGGGGNALLIADMRADGCVLSTLRLGSCVRQNGQPLLILDYPQKPVSFCNEGKDYRIAAVPDIEAGMIYTCPISFGAGGFRDVSKLSIVQDSPKDTEMQISTGKILVPRQSMLVLITAKNTGRSAKDLRFFAMLGDDIQEKGVSIGGRSSQVVDFRLTGPQAPGNYTLFIFSSSGDLEKEDIAVISSRQAKITEIGIPGEMRPGGKSSINVSIRNFGDELDALVKVRAGDLEYSRRLVIKANGTAVASFDFEAAGEGKKPVIISLLDSSGRYQDSWTGSIDVISEPSMKEGIAQQLEDFFLWLVSAIRSLLGF